MKASVRWLILLGVMAVAVGLAAGPDSWAAPGQSPERQTVPKRTPTPTVPVPDTPQPTSPPPATEPGPRPTLTSEGAPAEPSVPSEPTAAEEASPPLLPDAGGPNCRLWLGVAMIVLGLGVLGGNRQMFAQFIEGANVLWTKRFTHGSR